MAIEYEIDRTEIPPSIFPVGADKTDLVDITQVFHQWRVYLNVRTGEIIDGEVYAEAMMKGIEDVK